MEEEDEESVAITSVSMAKGSFSVNDVFFDSVQNESARLRSVDNSLFAESFTGRGLNVIWDKAGDDMESENGGFSNEFLESMFEDNDTKEDTNRSTSVQEIAPADIFQNSYNISPENSLRGNRIKDKYVFVLEILSNQHMRMVLFAIYAAFFTMLTIENIYDVSTHETDQCAVIPKNATGEEHICRHEPSGECVPHTVLTVGEASLLANTVIVSEGVNVTDWRDYGAKPGTARFDATNVTLASFMANSSFLHYNANGDLHPFWDDIVGVLWSGQSGSEHFTTVQSATVNIEFKKLKGAWPANITDNPVGLHISSFSCVRGGEGFCESVGNWRTLLYDNQVSSTKLKGEGTIFSVSLVVFNFHNDKDIILRKAVRIIFKSDPGGVVTDCLNGNDCTATVNFEGVSNHVDKEVKIWLLFCYFVVYLSFLVWWILSLNKRKGSPKTWPDEDWWLLFVGIGFLLAINPVRLGLSLDMIYSDSFVFKEGIWAASELISQFGQVMTICALSGFVDAPKKYVTSTFTFWRYKVLFLFICYAFFAITSLWYFPKVSGYDEPGTDYAIGGIGFGTSPISWKEKNQKIYIFAMGTKLICLFFIYFYYMWKLLSSFRVLQRLPYGMTRHTQLSSRFFFFATFLWITTLLSVFIHNMIIILENGDYRVSNVHLSGILEVFDAMLAFNSTQGLTSTLFLLSFLIIFHILFLPVLPDKILNKSKTHHISEDGVERYIAIERLRGKFLMVLDTAKLSCICSHEVYMPIDREELSQMMSAGGKSENETSENEDRNKSVLMSTPENSQSAIFDGETRSGKELSYTDSSTNIEEANTFYSCRAMPSIPEGPGIRIAGDNHADFVTPESAWEAGCRVVVRIREPGNIDLHGTRVVIFRHDLSGDLIVSFRGTATTKQVMTDLMMSKVRVCLDRFLAVPSLSRICPVKGKKIDAVPSSTVEEQLLSGEINRVSLMDLLPKTTEELPSYLKDAQRAQDGISGVGAIHFGFWSSYNRVRKNIHKYVRQELLSNPGRLILTGHSLGGAQATVCAYDMCRWMIPSLKMHFANQNKNGTASLEKLHVSCYSFGSPKVGGPRFKMAYNKVVPDTQRIVCDGDVITSGPPALMGYYHVGRENIFDFTGTIRVEPNLVEQKLMLKTRNKANSHKMTNYYKVIEEAYNPMISEEELLDILRDYYGMKNKCGCPVFHPQQI